MSQKNKLIQKLKAKPKSFTFDDAEVLLGYFDYSRSNKGRTSRSRVMFVSDKHPPILLYKPHPRKELLEYQGVHPKGAAAEYLPLLKHP